MYSLLVHPDAKADLDALFAGSKAQQRAAARILALLQEIKSSQSLLDSLTDHDFGAHRSALFHVSKWNEFWNRRVDLWRLKLWDLEDAGIQYRIIYAYDRARRYHILGIVPRSFDYDPSNAYSKRIRKAYDQL